MLIYNVVAAIQASDGKFLSLTDDDPIHSMSRALTGARAVSANRRFVPPAMPRRLLPQAGFIRPPLISIFRLIGV